MNDREAGEMSFRKNAEAKEAAIVRSQSVKRTLADLKTAGLSLVEMLNLVQFEAFDIRTLESLCLMARKELMKGRK